MGFLDGITKLGMSVVKAGRTAQYGKQIGKMSKNGLLCFEKNIKGGKSYTTLEAATGNVVRTKNIFRQKNYMTGQVWDANNNVVSSFSQSRTPLGYGFSSSNQFAQKIQNTHTTYNKFGQVTSCNDTTIFPTQKAGWLEISSNGSNYCRFVG